MLKNFAYIELNFTHESIVENVLYSRLRFYGLDIISSTVNTVQATVKQDFSIFKFNFWDEATLSNLVQGDTLVVPSLSSVVKYAWYGETNLLDIANVTWRAIVTTPSKKEENYNITGTESINLSEKGIYNITFRAFKDNDGLVIDLYESKDINVISNKLIYFMFPNYEIKIDLTKIVCVDFSSLLNEDSIQVVDVIYDEEVIDVSQTENDFEYEITGKKKGSSKLTIKFLAKRNTNSNEYYEYTATTNIKIEETTTNNNILFILSAVLLGIILVVGLIYGIKTVEKDRRNDVK